ncbi:MAG: hypothetical protein NDJ92_01175 [Thermoanaerobaculia bacterium]|nr:hypothetical protein [Thermoanaerobaculia bacterium]
MVFAEVTKETEQLLAEEESDAGKRAIVEELLQGAGKKSVDSTSAAFEVIEPTGVDKQVWESMRLLDRAWTVHSWGKATLAEDVVKKYPGSGYAPYALLHVRATEIQDFVGTTEELLRVHANSPVAPEIARVAFEVRRVASLGGEDLEGRLHNRRQAEATLSSVLKNPKVPEWWKAMLRDAGDSLPTEQTIRQWHAEAHAKHKSD